MCVVSALFFLYRESWAIKTFDTMAELPTDNLNEELEARAGRWWLLIRWLELTAPPPPHLTAFRSCTRSSTRSCAG